MSNSSLFGALRQHPTFSLLESLLKEEGTQDPVALSRQALAHVNAREPEWALLAGQLQMLNLRKDWDDETFCQFIRRKVSAGLYTPLFDSFTDQELEEASSWVDLDRDLLYPVSGSRLFIGRYLAPEERPQWVYLSIALLLASKEADRLVKARAFYDELSLLRISLATPLLLGLRHKDANLSSCFIAAANDSLDSLTKLWSEVAQISKAGGGVGVNLSRVRANGSWVKGNPNAAGGVTGWARIIDQIAVVVNQGGKRAGAVTLSIDMWHLDIPSFLDIQTENGDQRKKAYNIFPQVVIPDEFMRRVISNDPWTLVDPYEVRKVLNIDLAPLHSAAFEKAYEAVEEAAAAGLLTLSQTVPARELYLKMLRTLIETGMPYQFFKDTANISNPNAHMGMIPSANLCVAGDTLILTEAGYQPIKSLANQWVLVWNGQQWSQVKVFRTGYNQPLLRVTLSDGSTLRCTHDHHFWVQEGEALSRVPAKLLCRGHQMIKYDLPPLATDVQWQTNRTFLSQDGEHERGLVSTSLEDLRTEQLRLQEQGVQTHIRQLSRAVTHEYGLFLTQGAWDLLNAAGHPDLGSRPNPTPPVEVVSVENLSQKEDTFCFTEPHRNLGMFSGMLTGQCVESFSNVVPHDQVHVCNLMSLNLARCDEETLPVSTRHAVRMLDNAIDLTEPPVSGAKHHNQLYRTIGLGLMGLADWFAKRKLAYTKSAEAGEQLMENIAYAAFQENILLAEERGSFWAFPGSRLSQGVIFGRIFRGNQSIALADISQLLGAHKAEQALTDPEFRLGLFRNAQMMNLPVLISQHDWDPIVEGLQKGARCSQLLAIAPNSSSSLLQGCSASFLPTYSRLFFDQGGRGAIPVVPPYLTESWWYYQENKSMDQNHVVDMAAALQRWVDTGISMELLFDLNREDYRQASFLLRTMVDAWKKRVKAIYYVRWVQKDQTKSSFEECASCAN